MAAVVVIVFVLATTPPGFGAITLVLFGTPRGPVADAAAYTLGSAAALGLIALVVMALICAALEFALKLLRSGAPNR